jgi:hypothetical protein
LFEPISIDLAGYVIVTSQVPITPEPSCATACTTALPAPIAVIVPFSSTLTILLYCEGTDQMNVPLTAVSGATVALSCFLVLILNDIALGLTVIS